MVLMAKKPNTLYVRLDDEIHERMLKASTDEDRTMAAIVRRALIEYLDKNHPVATDKPKGKVKQ
jgi:predicted transcriptional regulator